MGRLERYIESVEDEIRKELKKEYENHILVDDCPNGDKKLSEKIRQLKKANKSLDSNYQQLKNNYEALIGRIDDDTGEIKKLNKYVLGKNENDETCIKNIVSQKLYCNQQNIVDLLNHQSGIIAKQHYIIQSLKKDIDELNRGDNILINLLKDEIFEYYRFLDPVDKRDEPFQQGYRAAVNNVIELLQFHNYLTTKYPPI